MADDAPAPAAESTPADVVADLSDEAVAALAAGMETPAAPETKGDDEPKADAEAKAKPEDEEKPEPPAAKPDPEVIKLRQLGAKLARRAQKLDAREGSLKTVEEDAKFAAQLRQLSRTDKIAALKALGINEDEIVDAVLARQPGAEKKQPTEAERIAALEAKLAEKERAEQAAASQRQQQSVLQQFQDEQIAKVKAAPGLDRVKGSERLQRDVIINMGQYHAMHGVIPDPVMVARYVEAADRVREELEKEDSPATGTPKKNPPPSTGKTKNTAAPSPSLTDRISDTPVGEDDLPDDPDERLQIAWSRLNA